LYIFLVTAAQVMKKMKEHGWIENRVTGSHHVFVKDGRRTVSVPKHGNRDMGPLAKKILKEAGITD
jgi:predicted RNA binding protein YcfA (HicA-like mRNA interferase family)